MLAGLRRFDHKRIVRSDFVFVSCRDTERDRVLCGGEFHCRFRFLACICRCFQFLGRGIRSFRRLLCRRGILRAGHGAANCRGAEQKHEDQNGNCGFRVLCDGNDARFELPAAPRHCRRRAEGIDPFAARHADERAAIVCTCVLAETADGILVAEELRVGAGKRRCPPHQRVEPVQREAHAAQDGPDVVAVEIMRIFVLRAVVQQLLVLRAVHCHVNRGREKPEQARRQRSPRQPDSRTALLRRDRAQNARPQLPTVPEVAEQEPKAQQNRAGGPYKYENLPHGNCGLLCSFCRFCAARFRLRRRGRRALHRLCGRLHRRCGRSRFWCTGRLRGRRGGGFRLYDSGRLSLRQEICHAEGGFPDGKRQQQPHEQHQPERVLQSCADFPAQQIVRADEQRRQHGGRNKPFSHGAFSPPSPAAVRAARRSRAVGAPRASSSR